MFFYRFPASTGRLQEGPFPTRGLGTFALPVRDDTWFDFVLHDRQQRFCPAGELSSNDERQVVRDIVGTMVVTNWKLSILNIMKGV
jgi:hypothetical protein